MYIKHCTFIKVSVLDARFIYLKKLVQHGSPERLKQLLN